MKVSAKTMKRLLNIYPPYLGAGIRIGYIQEDWSELEVSMKARWYNKNAVGTHFGGSIYSMTDPHIMLLVMQRLGKGYWVWDKSAEIDFIKATTKRISSTISISQSQIDEIRIKTASGQKYLPEFDIDIHDEEMNLIARVKKTLYIKKRPATD